MYAVNNGLVRPNFEGRLIAEFGEMGGTVNGDKMDEKCPGQDVLERKRSIRLSD